MSQESNQSKGCRGLAIRNLKTVYRHPPPPHLKNILTLHRWTQSCQSQAFFPNWIIKNNIKSSAEAYLLTLLVPKLNTSPLYHLLISRTCMPFNSLCQQNLVTLWMSCLLESTCKGSIIGDKAQTRWSAMILITMWGEAHVDNKNQSIQLIEPQTV